MYKIIVDLKTADEYFELLQVVYEHGLDVRVYHMLKSINILVEDDSIWLSYVTLKYDNVMIRPYDEPEDLKRADFQPLQTYKVITKWKFKNWLVPLRYGQLDEDNLIVIIASHRSFNLLKLDGNVGFIPKPNIKFEEINGIII